jgi:hypothetical protein
MRPGYRRGQITINLLLVLGSITGAVGGKSFVKFFNLLLSLSRWHLSEMLG